MPYAVVAYFDSQSDAVIRNVWKRLAEAQVCDYLYHSANNPHIKLGMFDEVYLEQSQRNIQQIAGTTKKKHFILN